MLKSVIGYIRIDSLEAMEQVSGIVNKLIVEHEEEDYIQVSLDHSPDGNTEQVFITLCEEGLITNSDLDEIPSLDEVKFYLD